MTKTRSSIVILQTKNSPSSLKWKNLLLRVSNKCISNLKVKVDSPPIPLISPKHTTKVYIQDIENKEVKDMK